MIKKLIIVLVITLFFTSETIAQVGINTSTPNENAVLEIASTSQGILLPRMTTAQRNAIVSPAKGLTIFNTTLNCIQTNIGTSSSANWKCYAGISPSSNGTAIVSSYSCSTASTGTLTAGVAVSGVTQTITVTVTTTGTYSIATTANGVTFSASGTFAATGAQDIVLTATGTPTAVGSDTFTLNTTPNCNYSRYTSGTGCYAKIATSPDVYKDFLCRNLGVTGAQDPFSYQSGANNGDLYQWGRDTDGHEVRTSATQVGPVTAPVANKFIKNLTPPSDWITPQSNTLWGDATIGADPAKAINDPCPVGFKVPSTAQWGALFRGGTTSGAPGTATQNTWTWTGNGYMVGTSLYLPAAGYRNYNDGILGAVGSNGIYWSSATNITESYYMGFASSVVNPSILNFRAYGFSVRCVKDDNNTNGTAVVSNYSCSTASAGKLLVGVAVSGVTQTITAMVTTVGTYNISTTTANGVTFSASGTFAATGAQNIVLTATGTPTAVGSHTFTLNTTPNCNFSRYTSGTGCYAKIATSPDVYNDFLCRNLGVTGTQDPFTYQAGANNGTLYQWGRNTDGHEVRTSATQAAPVTAPVANKFITRSSISNTNSNYDWLNPQNSTLWGDGTTGVDPAKTANDPCPTGFKVPSQAQWSGLFIPGSISGEPINATQNTWTWTGNGYALSPIGAITPVTLYLPAAGYRDFTGQVYVNNIIMSGGKVGRYWSSSVNGRNSFALDFNYNTGFLPVVSIRPFDRGYGNSIRCIKDDNNTNGTALVSAFSCSTGSAGILLVGVAVSGVTQTITAMVTHVGTYNISTTTANGVTFSGSGTFAGTGAQDIVLTATGTPTAATSDTFTLNTTPNCNFSRTTETRLCGANVNGTFKQFMCYNLGVTGTQAPFSYQSGANNGALYQWGRDTDGHEVRTSATQAGPLTAPVVNKFITNTTVTPYDWITPQSNTLWGDGTTVADPAKGTTDPCPAGFKVPSQNQWGAIFRGGTTSGAPGTATQNLWTWTGNGYMVGTSLYLPASGYRNFSDGALVAVSSNGIYWSSATTVTTSYYLSFSSVVVIPGSLNYRAFGMSVRCISE